MLTRREVEKFVERETEIGPDGIERPGPIRHIREVTTEPATLMFEREDLDALFAMGIAEVIAEQSQDAAKTIASAITRMLEMHRDHVETLAKLGREEIAHESAALIADAALAMVEKHPGLRSAFETLLGAAQPAASARLETLKGLQDARERLLTEQTSQLEAVVSAFRKATATA